MDRDVCVACIPLVVVGNTATYRYPRKLTKLPHGGLLWQEEQLPWKMYNDDELDSDDVSSW